jgi:uncharacterized protein (DUF305 family)
MERPNFPIGIVVTSLIVGLLIGRMTVKTASAPGPAPSTSPMEGMHRMPDGSMMPNMGAPAPQTMQHTMDGMIAALTDKTGPAFDQTFLDEMIVHHQGAVDMARMVLERSERPELRTLANDIIAAQTKEIDMMSRWRSEWSAR